MLAMDCEVETDEGRDLQHYLGLASYVGLARYDVKCHRSWRKQGGGVGYQSNESNESMFD